MSTGELLDRTFRLYKDHFKLFLGIATLGPAAMLAFQLLTAASTTLPGATGNQARAGAYPAAFGVGVIAGVVIMLAGMALAHAATVRAVAAVYLGRQISIGASYGALKGRVWRVLGLFFAIIFLVGLCGFVIIAAAVALGSLAVLGGAQAGRTGAVAGGLVGIAAAVIGGLLAIAVYVRYSLSIQACVVEDQGIRGSMRRSVFLCKGSRGRVLAIYFVFGILAWIVSIGLGGLAGGISVLIPNKIAGFVIIYLASFVSGSLTGPLATIGMSLLYYDERVRKEAFDLQLMMATLDETAPGAPVPVPAQ
jgi:hypothetical protein